MAEITPITREEFYLAKAGGQDVPVPSAVTRKEHYLEKLSNDSVVVSSPVTRREKFLYFACGGEIDLPSEDKMTRLERLIAKAGGMDVSTPTAVTRLEKFWANVEGGGWKTITGVLPLTFTTTENKLRDWEIRGNDEPGTEQLFDKSASTSDKVVGNNGAETTSYDRSHSDYIPVTTGSYYVSNILQANQFYQIVGFDENKQFTKIYNFTPLSYTAISGVVNVEETTKYIIINYQSTNKNDVSVTKGSTAPDHYIPYQQGVGELVNDHYEIPIYSYPSNLPQIKKDLIGAKVHETQVTSRKGNETLTWDVIGIDHDEAYYQDGTRAQHSVTLQMHDFYASLQFDAREALFAFSSGLAAGTYHFTVSEQPWYAADVNKIIQFTLTQDIAAGGMLVLNNAFNQTMVGATISSFASCEATTATETVTMSEGSSGTDLGTVSSSINGDTNSIQRAFMGSNNWSQSAIRQWLSSKQVAGQVWTPQTKWDRPPSWASNIAGFLNGFDEDFASAIGKTKKATATDDGEKAESIETVFLLSHSEVYGGNEVTGGDGTAYSYYSDYSDLFAPGRGADSNRIKHQDGTAKTWWIRSPRILSAQQNERCIVFSGAIAYTDCYGNQGVVPAVVIPMDEVYSYHFNIGGSPLTAGQSISKTSTGVDIAAIAGSNTITTELYNKPTMEIKYK